MFQFLGGRLFVRTTMAKQVALVGVVQLPADRSIRENAAYLMMMLGGVIEVADTPVDDGIPAELEGQGLNAALEARIWRTSRLPGVLSVRFLPALPDQRLWIVYGTSNHPLPGVRPAPDTGDAWLDCRHGMTFQIPAPTESLGAKPAQILTNHPVWPDANGVLHTFPQHPPRWRVQYHRMTKLLARCGAGDLSEAELVAMLRADRDLSLIRPMWIDQDYLEYLAAMDANGALHMDEPRTAAEHDAREAAALAHLRCNHLISA